MTDKISLLGGARGNVVSPMNLGRAKPSTGSVCAFVHAAGNTPKLSTCGNMRVIAIDAEYGPGAHSRDDLG